VSSGVVPLLEIKIGASPPAVLPPSAVVAISSWQAALEVRLPTSGVGATTSLPFPFASQVSQGRDPRVSLCCPIPPQFLKAGMLSVVRRLVKKVLQL
jgi:hypothetical protein